MGHQIEAKGFFFRGLHYLDRSSCAAVWSGNRAGAEETAAGDGVHCCPFEATLCQISAKTTMPIVEPQDKAYVHVYEPFNTGQDLTPEMVRN